MARKVENPFKEEGIPSWIRYLVSGLIGFCIAWLLLAGSRGSPVDSGVQSPSSLQAQNGNLRPANQEGNDDFTERYQNDDVVAPDDEVEFPPVEQEEYLGWVRSFYDQLEFEPRRNQHKLTEYMLEESLELGCNYMAMNQKKDTGNFNYQYDFVEQKMDTDDSPVRQAGALWGMTLCFQSRPDSFEYRSSVEKGIAFFRDHTIDGPVPGSQMIKYPDFEESQSGVNALYGLSLIDYIRTIRDNDLPENHNPEDGVMIREIEDQLAMIIKFLKYMQNSDLHFSEAYIFEDEEKSIESSPYYDGETLLCLVKAAKYMEGYEEPLVPIIEEAAPVLAKSYTIDAWRNDEHDSDLTKGFYQWSSMVFTEYYFAEWEDYEFFGDLVLVLAHWIVHTHAILHRNRNTGYAFEGIISAYRIAQSRNHFEALMDLMYTIDTGLSELTSWQVGGPLADTNKFLVENPTDENIAIGGVMNARNLAPLRIDTTQHQMHAVMMALETIFVDEPQNDDDLE